MKKIESKSIPIDLILRTILKPCCGLFEPLSISKHRPTFKRSYKKQLNQSLTGWKVWGFCNVLNENKWREKNMCMRLQPLTIYSLCLREVVCARRGLLYRGYPCLLQHPLCLPPFPSLSPSQVLCFETLHQSPTYRPIEPYSPTLTHTNPYKCHNWPFMATIHSHFF